MFLRFEQSIITTQNPPYISNCCYLFFYNEKDDGTIQIKTFLFRVRSQTNFFKYFLQVAFSGARQCKKDEFEFMKQI